MKQLSLVTEGIVPYQKIFQLEKEIEAKEIKEIDYKIKRRIRNNQIDISTHFGDKTRASMREFTLVQSIILSLLLWLFLLWVRHGLLCFKLFEKTISKGE